MVEMIRDGKSRFFLLKIGDIDGHVGRQGMVRKNELNVRSIVIYGYLIAFKLIP